MTKMVKFYLRKEARIPFTKEGLEKVYAEKAALLADRPDAVENLRKAREMGDLSENGYYKAARARLSFLDARLRRVERLVKLGVIVSSSQTGKVEIGSKVTITDGLKDYQYTIVGGYESNPSEKTISYISPIGKAIFGKGVGDEVFVTAPKGIIKYIIKNIEL
jgi:transcription elongation factor GreA